MRNFYEILEVEKNVTKEELKRSYKKLAKKYHPDLNPGDEVAEARFKEISYAYEVLSDDEKRQVYDVYGEEGLKGNMHGAFEFWKAAQKAGVKPIIGIEAYMTPGTSRFDRTRVQWGQPEQKNDDVSARGAYTHMTLLSENNTGMHNLFRMSSQASIEGQFGKWPRMDLDLLQRYHSGLIGTTGCPSGAVQTRIRLGQMDEALRTAGELQDIFGKNNFFVEIMDHGIDIERRVITDLLELAKKIDAPLLASNDSHYVRKEDAPVQDALLCVNSGRILSEPDRFN